MIRTDARIVDHVTEKGSGLCDLMHLKVGTGTDCMSHTACNSSRNPLQHKIHNDFIKSKKLSESLTDHFSHALRINDF